MCALSPRKRSAPAYFAGQIDGYDYRCSKAPRPARSRHDRPARVHLHEARQAGRRRASDDAARTRRWGRTSCRRWPGATGLPPPSCRWSTSRGIITSSRTARAIRTACTMRPFRCRRVSSPSPMFTTLRACVRASRQLSHGSAVEVMTEARRASSIPTWCRSSGRVRRQQDRIFEDSGLSFPERIPENKEALLAVDQADKIA